MTLIFAAAFLAFVTGTVATGRLPFLVLSAYLVASFIAYLAYLLDKSASVQGRWRTPESTLHLLSLVGGWPGAMFAQRLLRHKTQKKRFQVTYWATVALNCAFFGWLLSPIGMAVVKHLVGAA